MAHRQVAVVEAKATAKVVKKADAKAEMLELCLLVGAFFAKTLIGTYLGMVLVLSPLGRRCRVGWDEIALFPMLGCFFDPCRIVLERCGVDDR